MTDADLDEVAALEAQVQAFPWTRGNFADALATGYQATVLHHEGRLAGFCVAMLAPDVAHRSEEQTSELQSLMRISYAGFCLKKKTKQSNETANNHTYITY